MSAPPLTSADWLDLLTSAQTEADLALVPPLRLTTPARQELSPATTLELAPADWGTAAHSAARVGLRLVALWGDPEADQVTVRACYETGGRYLVVATRLPTDASQLPSIAALFPGGDRLQRHLHDLLGVGFSDWSDERRWTRHQAWPADQFPLRTDFPLEGKPPRRARSDSDYPFAAVRGNGVYEIPVGPVHAGIIEPGHFRFQAMGEEVLRLEARLGYVHKGIEKLAVGRSPAALARLAGRVSGDTTVAHTWAACQAMERAANCPVPARALQLRAVLCERERVANHLGDIGAICNDVAFVFAHVQCARLREQWQRTSADIYGHRLLMDTIVPGGVANDISAHDRTRQIREHHALRAAVAPLFDVIDDHPSLADRLLGTGVLAAADARELGCTGYLGKASGQAFDVRAHAAYAPYDALEVAVRTFDEGDVAARVRVRMHEILASLDLLDRLLDQLAEGPASSPSPLAAANASGLGIIDGWRGEILTFVRFAEDGSVARFFPRDPSWFSWPALERLIHGNIVPDFPVCNKSVNASYAGHDL